MVASSLKSILWKNRGVLAALVGLGVLAGWALALSGEGDKDGLELAEEIRSPVTWQEGDLGSINRLSLSASGNSLEFYKDETGYWRMLQDHYLARQAEVQILVDSITFPDVERQLECTPHHRQMALESGVLIAISNAKGMRLEARRFKLDSHPQHLFWIYTHRGESCLKVYDENPREISLAAESYRSLRLFPFSLEVIRRLEYRQGGRNCIFEREGGEIISQTADMNLWTPILKKFQVAPVISASRITGESDSPPLASYHFTFMSGDNTELDLFADAQGVYVRFRGNNYLSRIDEETRGQYFPALPP